MYFKQIIDLELVRVLYCIFKVSYFYCISVLVFEQIFLNVKMNVIEMNFVFIFIEEKEVDGFVNNDENDEDKYDEDEDNFIMNMSVLDDFLFIFQVLIVLNFINKGNVFIRKRKIEVKEVVKVFIFFKRRFIFKVIFVNLDLFKVKLKVKVKFGKIFVRLKR